MTIREAMEKRHMVRQYKDTVLSKDVVEKLKDRIGALNQEFHLNLSLHLEDGNISDLA